MSTTDTTDTTSTETSTFRTERYNIASGGWYYDAAEVHGLIERVAVDVARRSTQGSMIRRRVVNETTHEVVASFARGQRIPTR